MNEKNMLGDFEISQRLVDICLHEDTAAVKFLFNKEVDPFKLEAYEKLGDLILMLINIKGQKPEDPFFYEEGLKYKEANWPTIHRLEKEAKELIKSSARINTTIPSNKKNYKEKIAKKTFFTDEANKLIKKAKKLRTQDELLKKSFYRTLKQTGWIYDIKAGPKQENQLMLGENSTMFTGSNDQLFYECWASLKHHLKLYPTNLDSERFRETLYKKEPRAYIIDLINAIPRERHAVVQKRIFKKVLFHKGRKAGLNTTTLLDGVSDNVGYFLKEFCKSKKATKVFGTYLSMLANLPSSCKIAHLSHYYSIEPKQQLSEIQFNFLTGKYNALYLSMLTKRKKNFMGHIPGCDFVFASNLTKTEEYDVERTSFFANHPAHKYATNQFCSGQFDLGIIDSKKFSEQQERIQSGRKKYYRPDFVAIKNVLKGIKNNGHLIVVLYNQRQLLHWSRFLRSNWVHPGNTRITPTIVAAGNTLTMLVLKKSNTTGDIVFADLASQSFSNQKKELKNILTNHTNKSKKISFKKFSSVHRWSLNIKRYFISGFKGLTLDKVSKIYRGSRSYKDKEGIIITPSSLGQRGVTGLSIKTLKTRKFSGLIPRLPGETTRTTSNKTLIQAYAPVKIEKSCLLVSPIGTSFSPAWFRYQGTPIFLRHGVYAIDVDENHTLGLFLQFALVEKNTLDQLGVFSEGAMVKRFSMHDLMHCIKIEIPNKKKQEEIIELKEKEKILQLEKEISQIKGREVKKKNENFDWLKHRLRKNLKQISDGNMKQKNFFSKLNQNFLEKVNKRFVKHSGETVEAFLLRMKNASEEISKTLQQFESYNLGEKKKIEYKDIVKILMSYKEKDTMCDVEVSIDMVTDYSSGEASGLVDDNPDSEEEPKDPIDIRPALYVNEQGLKIILDETITNAKKYGMFSEKNKGKVLITMSTIAGSLERFGKGTLVVIGIKNNGKPMPKGWGKKEFSERNKRGPKTNEIPGSGNGGSYVAEHAEDFCEEWTIINSPESEYPVEFIFKFKTYLLD